MYIGDCTVGSTLPALGLRALALTLLMLGVGANDPHNPFAPDHLTFVTHRLDRAPYFHGEGPPFSICTDS